MCDTLMLSLIQSRLSCIIASPYKDLYINMHEWFSVLCWVCRVFMRDCCGTSSSSSLTACWHRFSLLLREIHEYIQMFLPQPINYPNCAVLWQTFIHHTEQLHLIQFQCDGVEERMIVDWAGGECHCIGNGLMEDREGLIQEIWGCSVW